MVAGEYRMLNKYMNIYIQGVGGGYGMFSAYTGVIQGYRVFQKWNGCTAIGTYRVSNKNNGPGHYSRYKYRVSKKTMLHGRWPCG